MKVDEIVQDSESVVVVCLFVCWGWGTEFQGLPLTSANKTPNYKKKYADFSV